MLLYLVMITPKFNPTGAPGSEVYARGRYSASNIWLPNTDSLSIFRLEERERVINGLGITASSIVNFNNLGLSGMGTYDPASHLLSRHENRIDSPFVSFGSNTFVRQLVEYHQWGQDPVVIEARIEPGRALVHPTIPEILLVGGLSSDEFITTHEVQDFVDNSRAK